MDRQIGKMQSNASSEGTSRLEKAPEAPEITGEFVNCLRKKVPR